jgi:alpha-ketoglutarate-dependent taurine dioxygenase
MTRDETPTPVPAAAPIGRVERRGVRLPRPNAIVTQPLRPGTDLPLLARPASPGADPVACAAEQRTAIGDLLLRHGAILFRGFGFDGVETFSRFIQALSGDLLEYRYRSTPRSEVGAGIYTSTEYPASEEIPPHNENSYAAIWPMKLFFFCELPAAEGGMTPIADSHRVHERIAPDVRARFAANGVAYVRNYGGGADLPWEQVFLTADRGAVEEFCRHAGIEFEWRQDGRLRTRQVCQATAVHPRTGRPLWFNQAHLFHYSSLAPAVREALLEVFGEEDLPRNATFGDGAPIPLADLEAVRAAYRQELVAFPWQRGDVLLLDNMAVAHARTPYSGERRLRVGMTEPVDGRELSL